MGSTGSKMSTINKQKRVRVTCSIVNPGTLISNLKFTGLFVFVMLSPALCYEVLRCKLQ